MKQFLLKSKLLLASLSVAATVGIVAVVVMLVSKDDEAYRTIKVIETSGEVKVTREDGEYAAYSGMILEEGYEIETAENSYVRLILDDDKYVKVEQGSKIIFEKLGLFGSNKTKIKIERGAMTCEIVKPLEGDDDFTVNTPNAVLAVRGTFFRVDLNYNDDGLVKTNVMTYGGKVAAQRVLSTGELVGTEVDVDTGNKVIISQINEVEDDGNVAENVIFESQVISVEDITDEDLVDVYFAIENGHEMFLDIEDVQDVLDIREIDIKEHISVYEKAKNIEENTGKSEVPSVTESEATTQLVTSQETSTEEETTEEETTEQVTTEETTSKLITIETTKAEETTTKVEETTTTKVEETTTTKVEETITTKVEETTTTKVEETTTKVEETTTKEEETTTEHIHTEVNGGEASIHKKCSGCGETLENGSFHEYTIEVTKTPTCTSLGVKTYSCGCGYSYTEDIPMESHVEVAGNEANVHKKCNTCGTTIEDGTYHSYTKEETSSATCTEKGENTYTCTCGHTYTEEIDYLDHNGVAGGEEEIHKKCGSCGETLENGSFHEYTIEVTKAPTCTALGVRTYTCGCGYSYTEDITMESHVEVAGNEANVHKKCNTCGTTIEDGTYHSYTKEETTSPTCTEKGENTYTCTCGHTYTEEIAALGHTKADENASSTTCITCGLPWVDISTTNFEDATLRTKLSEFDTDGDGALIGAELTDITSISVAGTADADGECKSLSGVELLPNLTQIDCSYNADLLSLDFSGNTKLYKLYCNNTGVQTINISGCTGLSTFDFTNCSELIEMNVSNTTLTSLIINSNPALATLNVEGNKFTTLNISGTQITSLELNNMSKSTNITVTDTPIQTVTISDSTLGNLTVSAISQLESITSTNSTINRVFADDCSGLKVLSVPDSEAVLVSIENTTLLEELNVSGSGLYDSFRLEGSMYPQLKTLDISNTENITSISVSECASLTSLNVTGCNMITSLDASNTAITSIDVTGCEMLGALDLNPTEIGSMADVTLPATHQIGSFGIGTYASSDVDIVFDASDIAWFSGLSSLDVSNARLDNDDFAAIKNVIGDNITTFKFSGNNSTNTGTTSGYLTELDLSGMKYIPGMEYSELSDVTLINISDSNITSIDFSGFTNLKTINAANSKLAELNASSNVLLETIDVSGCTILASIVMNYTENTYALSSVNLTGCTALVDITLYGCSNLTTMDLTDCTNLEIVSLESCTGLTSIDLSNNDKLTGVALSHTNITTLDLSGKTSISQVYLMNCANLTTIDLSNSSVDYINLAGCTSVTSVNVTGNTNANQILSVHYTGTAYDDAVFTKSDGFTVEQEPMA